MPCTPVLRRSMPAPSRELIAPLAGAARAAAASSEFLARPAHGPAGQVQTTAQKVSSVGAEVRFGPRCARCS